MPEDNAQWGRGDYKGLPRSNSWLHAVRTLAEHYGRNSFSPGDAQLFFTNRNYEERGANCRFYESQTFFSFTLYRTGPSYLYRKGILERRVGTRQGKRIRFSYRFTPDALSDLGINPADSMA